MRKTYFIVIFVTLFLLFSVQTVYAATLTVDAGTPYAVADGRCSIVEAIDNANNDAATHADCPAGAGADNIILTRNIALSGTTLFTAAGDNGLPSITSDITIDAEGFSIVRRGATPFRFFHVAAAANLTLNRVTLSNGLLSAGFDNGGAIHNDGNLTINESTLQNNRLETIFPSGGAIYNNGNLTLNNTIIRNNSLLNATFSNGGGIYSNINTSITMTNTTIANNQAGERGGGIYSAGDVLMNNSTINANTAQNGAGMLAFDSAAGNTVQIYNSTFSNNVASESGGGLLSDVNGVDIFGSTFRANRVQGASALIGGGIFNQGGIMTITNTLIENNRALNNAVGGGIGTVQLADTTVTASIIRANRSNSGGGGFYNALATTSVYDSLVTQNSAPNGGGFFDGASNVDGFDIHRTSIINNSATGFGGGFYAEGNQNTNFITNSTIANNTSPTFGAGVMLNSGGQVELLHTTVANNSSTQFANSVGGTNFFAGTASVTSSIIANNNNTDCSATNASTSGDYNITTGPAGGIPVDRWCSFIPIQPNDLTSTNPLLAPLAQNGSIGQSFLLQAGSPAIDAIPFNCPAALADIDQRGVPRPAGSCDVGPISDELIILPVVSFTSATTVINNEATAVTPATVEIVVDNTNGNLAAPGSLPLTIYLTMTGTAADGADFTDNIAIPTTNIFNAGNFPAPGTTATITLDFTVIDDLIYEGNETIELGLSLIGPGVPGQITTHRLTIIDNETPPPVNQAPIDQDANPAIGVFDPAISKLGFLTPGQTGVSGEQIEWIVTISNPGDVPGQNVTITDTLQEALRVDSVNAPGASVSINGQTVTVTYATLNPGETVQFSIFTTVLDGASLSNTACVNASNQAADECATGSFVSQLPRTGETPVIPSIALIGGAILLLLASGAIFIGKRLI